VEINQVDCGANSEVTSVVYLKNYVFSSHSDGTLNVWEGSKNIIHLVHKAQDSGAHESHHQIVSPALGAEALQRLTGQKYKDT
jgi:hypothetical protein